MHQTEDGLLEVGAEKRSESEICPRALRKVLHTGCHVEHFFLSDILRDTFHDFHHEHDC
jgi:hypothetical protein